MAGTRETDDRATALPDATTSPQDATASGEAPLDALTIAGRTLRSRLLLGTGGFPSLERCSRRRSRRAAASS